MTNFVNNTNTLQKGYWNNTNGVLALAISKRPGQSSEYIYEHFNTSRAHLFDKLAT